MCGIVGYVGYKESLSILILGLRALEYRGYDSSGIAISDAGRIHVFKKAGNLPNLLAILPAEPIKGSCGIAHTRWATHGIVNDENAHPHSSPSGRFVAVHNGIFDNYEPIKAQLIELGYNFSGATDTEVFVCYVEHLYDQQILQYATNTINRNVRDEVFLLSVRTALDTLKGTYAVNIMFAETDAIVAARNISPLVIGIGTGENYIASDTHALAQFTSHFVYLPDNTVALVKEDNVRLMNLAGDALEFEIHEVTSSEELSKYGDESFPHKMLLEIMQQPEVFARIIADTVDDDNHIKYRPTTVTSGVELDISGIKRIQLIACGTAYHAALYGKYVLEHLARIHTSVETASEFRYRDPVIDAETLVLVVSQSGETIDTLEALRLAKIKGSKSIGIINVPNSAIAREVDSVFHIRAGKEVGVASSKAFTGMLLALAIFAIYLGESRGELKPEVIEGLVTHIKQLPTICEITTELVSSQIKGLVDKYSSHRSMCFFGRGNQYPIALEGALKLKEVSYIHSEGYPAGELKHGPIALIDENMPTIAIATTDAELFGRVMSNIQEVIARKGPVIALTDKSNESYVRGIVTDVMVVPDVYALFSPLITVIPLQLFAYEMAVTLGRNVDQPRNLAKAVTVT